MLEHVYSQIGGADNIACNMRAAIINAEDNITAIGTKYYVSPNGNDANDGKSLASAKRTLNADIFTSDILKPGDAVLFERGGIWRTDCPVQCKSGIYYGAYGEGSKPKFYASQKNYASQSLWRASASLPNVWITDVRQTDAGIIVFDDALVGVKKIANTLKDADLANNGDFYHDVYSGLLFLYCDKGNPGDIFNNIEIGLNHSVFEIAPDICDVSINNLCIKYSGAFGIKGCSNNHNITVKNCEIGWIGGSVLYYNNKTNKFVQYGNGIQFWYRAYNICVENCWIYQIYDAALTFQGRGPQKSEFVNVSFERNLIEFSSMNFEYWAGDKGANSKIHNILFKENVLRFSGYGWGSLQRSTIANQAFILSWDNHFEDMKDFFIVDNIFDCADSNFIYSATTSPQNGLTIMGNTYYQKKTTGRNPNVEIIKNSCKYAENQQQFENAVKEYEHNPKLVKWLDDI